MKPRFRVTYQIVTPESAEQGDMAEGGYVHPGGWHDPEPIELTLREALSLCYPAEDCGNWFTEVDPDIDYGTGAEELRSLHPPRGISAASYSRLRRALGIK